MIASLFWKEYREHRSVWIAMALLAVVSLTIANMAVLPQGVNGSDQDNVASVVGGALILAGMYGLVCGAMMFAGERESRGMPFLEALPLSRAELWWSKCLFGLVFVLLYAAVIVGTGAALGVLGPDGIPARWAVVVPLVGVETFALSLFTSTYCRSVLSAVAFAALLPLPVLWLVSGMCLASSTARFESYMPGVLVVHALATLAALGVSLGTFVDRDFERRFVLKPRSTSYGTVAPKRQPRRFEVLLWLVLRQGSVLVGVLCVLGFFVGLALPVAGAGVWPAATLMVGVACGTAVFMGEQTEGAFKFWGDQRLPVGWLWLRRSGFWAGVAAVASLLMLVGGMLSLGARGGMAQDHRPLFEQLLNLSENSFGAGGILAFLLVWPAYGFALGQLCSLVWRKSAVAVVVAVMTGAGVAALWLPSLVGGGLHLVQALAVPLVLLGGCRLALWDWVTDRLRTRPSVVRLNAAVVLAWLCMAAGFAFRVVEAPATPEPFDQAAALSRLGNPDEARAGQKIRAALTLAKDRDRAGPGKDDGVGAPDVPPGPPQPGGPPVPIRPIGPPQPVPIRPPPPLGPAERWDEVRRVIEQGWGAATPQLRGWLDRMAADPWPAQMADGARMAPGVYIDPRTTERLGRDDAAEALLGAQLLTARALQVQARGDDEKALDYLITVLALSRHLRHQAPAYAYLQGVEAERGALVALDHWLNRLGGRPQLLGRARDALKEHEAAVAPVSEVLEGEYLHFCSGLGGGGRAGTAMGVDTEALAMQTPWEAARARRLTAAVFAGRRRMAESGEVVPWSDDDAFADWLPAPGGVGRERLERLVGSSWLAGSFPPTAPAQRAAQLSQCRARAARLQLALALYRAEHGKAAASLDDLGPGLPEDPFARQPFHYRVSAGERIAWQRRLPGGGVEFVRDVPAGWGVLWSVGPDGNDDGAARQWEDGKRAQTGRDMIFLVPPGKGKD